MTTMARHKVTATPVPGEPWWDTEVARALARRDAQRLEWLVTLAERWLAVR